MFVVTTAGGLLGTFAPHLQLTSPMEMVLNTHNTFLLDAIHPKTADVATILGYEQARPMAPFAYANTWGAAYAFFLPFFAITWIWRAEGKRRALSASSSCSPRCGRWSTPSTAACGSRSA